MTIPTQTEEKQQQTEEKRNDKEYNFRQLEAKYHRQLEQEREARLHAERAAQEAMSRQQQAHDTEENDDEPYVDHKKLDKKLAKFGEKSRQETQSEIQKAVQTAIYKERQEAWLKNNPDFSDVLGHAEKFAMHDPELAEAILDMPDGFERQKLVYKNIKALGLHLPEQKQSTIQDKVDANRRNPYYQPSGVGSAPYAQQGDFSNAGKQQAYSKMKELQQRIGVR